MRGPNTKSANMKLARTVGYSSKKPRDYSYSSQTDVSEDELLCCIRNRSFQIAKSPSTKHGLFAQLVKQHFENEKNKFHRVWIGRLVVEQ